MLPIDKEPVTSFAIGEEDDYTTLAVGEEDGPVTTQALGEETVTSFAIGEEDGTGGSSFDSAFGAF